MKKFKMSTKDSIISMVEKSMINLPTPVSISFMWNMGFMLGMVLMLQIVTGLTLSMNYIPHTDMAFDSVIHISRDIDYGWTMRYAHMNGASLFFMLMYTHIFRGIYFNSPEKLPMVWTSGIVIMLFSMGAAFMGYVLPWGQMSLWGATVITSMISAIPYLGKMTMEWLWGNFSVSQPTLNRFFSFHFLIPMLIVVLVMAHLIFLHVSGSSNPLMMNPNYDKMSFFPYFVVKDVVPMSLVLMALLTMICVTPNLLGDAENFNKAMSSSTPPHIQPEWYFLFAYAILRAIPSKLGGVVAMLSAILVLTVLSMKNKKNNKKFSPKSKIVFWMMVSTVTLLTWIGANPVEEPYILVGQMVSMVYFSIFVVL